MFTVMRAWLGGGGGENTIYVTVDAFVLRVRVRARKKEQQLCRKLGSVKNV